MRGRDVTYLEKQELDAQIDEKHKQIDGSVKE